MARTYLSNTQIHMTTGALTKVRPDWGGTNIICTSRHAYILFNQFHELITQHESDELAAPFIVKSLLPIVYINKKRMQKANSLLLHSDMTIAEIAEQLGMQTPYLSRMFKITGFSPNEFRQQHRMSQRL